LRSDSAGEGRVFAVAPKSTTALVGAAHAGNGAYWINNMTANWATTAYYKEMPVPIRDRNYLNPLANRLDSMKWTPLLNLSLYPGITASEMRKPFRQTFPRKEVNRVSRFIESPLANTEVTDVASDLITALSLGSGKNTDMITIGYTLPSNGSRAEIIDSYIRLDRDLEHLFHILERACQNSTGPTIMLAGLPSNAGSAPDDKRWNIPSGLYSVKRAVSLLGIHLMSVHGNGDWITGYHDRHFFLNRQLIKDRGLNLQDFRREVADFLGRMAGICNVITIDDILASRAGDNPDALKRNTSFTHAGDVIIEICPGWQIIDDGTGRASGALRHTAVDIPAFFIAPGLKRLHITESTDARTLAPTLSRLLLIRAPNGASVPALNL
ncbi:MAG: hypothetical protein K2L46_02820, partial [Paramuribaculum sp.]|nr:hypothetical protein [Paramuribaculum sp.]